MKRLISLIACMTLACVSVSCGNKQKETDNVSVSDSAVTEVTAETETKTEPETETTVETTEKTESETTTESKESSTESETEKIKTSAPENKTENEKPEITIHEYIENADPTAFLGKWECEKAVIDGEEMTDIGGIPVYAVFQLDIKDDNTASMADNMAEYSVTEDALSYTWGMVSETEIGIISENGDAMLCSMDGDYLVGTDIVTDDVIYLVRVDEFTHFDVESFINGFNESDKTAFFGKWECERAVIGGEEMTDINGVPLNLMYQFDFKEDGTVLLGEVIAEIMEETSWSWSMLSKTEIAVIDGENDAMLLTLDGNYLIVTDDTSDDMIYLVRVNEFTSVDDLNS